MPTAVDLLLHARKLVAAGWTQAADARAADGSEVEPWAEDAVAWSLLGAIVAALEDQQARAGGQLPLPELALALDALADFLDDDSLSAWNDRPGRTPADVQTALDHAAKQAAQSTPPLNHSPN